MSDSSPIYTFEELEGRAKEALEVPELVEIVKNAPLHRDRVNLSWAKREAEKCLKDQLRLRDLQKIERLVNSTRFLAMMRRNYEEKFEEEISRVKASRVEQAARATEEAPARKRFELRIPAPNMDDITVISRSGEVVLSFCNAQSLAVTIGLMIGNISESFDDFGDLSREFKDQAIKFLEEKLGMRVVDPGDSDGSEEDKPQKMEYRRAGARDSIEAGDLISVIEPGLSSDYKNILLAVTGLRGDYVITMGAGDRFYEDMTFMMSSVRLIHKLVVS